MVRNAAIAAGNSGDPALLPALSALLDDPSPVVRDAAGWAIHALSVPRPAG
jgi:epoxyqueuosine reductase